MDLRTIILGASAFCATFVVGWWLNIGALIYGSGTTQAQPVAMAGAPATTGQGAPAQGSSPGPSVPRLVAVSTPSGTILPRTQTPQIGSPQVSPSQVKAPQERSAQVKDLRPQNAAPTPPRRGFRFRRR